MQATFRRTCTRDWLPVHVRQSIESSSGVASTECAAENSATAAQTQKAWRSPVEHDQLFHVVPELGRLAVWHLWEDASGGLVGLDDDVPAHERFTQHMPYSRSQPLELAFNFSYQ